IYSVALETGKINILTDRKGPDYNPVISPDGKTIAYLGYEDKIQTYQLPELYTMKIDGSGKKKVNLKLDRQVSNLTWNQKGDGLYFQYDSEGNSKIGYTTLSGKFELVAENVGGTGVARPYGGGSFSISKNDLIAFNITTPKHPADLATISKGGKVSRISNLNAELLNYRTLGEVEEIWYNSSYDERKIQGWVVKPPFFEEGKKYPLVVENHGGPISNYGDRFSPEMQLYATAGFVVFYPNPRGSTSYGEEFGNLLYHNYPSQDYDDVISGVDVLIAKGLVHEDSLFVTGGSAGGIMTAWIIGKTNRFRAAAVVKPVMNWYSKTLVADNWYGYYHYRYPGYPWENQEAYMKFSPISLVGNIETPAMVMVGTSDLRTPLSEAKQLYHALKIRKIETALVEVPGAFHFIANRPSQLITKIDHIVAWFNKFRKENH
ncbi:MAG: S9 family peptidase, partial [Flammeovirgaceae bacterium]|nr:S9 family peptidase [Flammeovirgaceae bacterium]